MLKQAKKFFKNYEVLSITTKATIWFIFCSAVQRLILILSTPIFTRLLTQEQYGQYAVYTSWLQVVTIITTLRLNAGGFNKGMSKFSNSRDEYVATVQFITTLFTIFAAVVYSIFHAAINNITELGTFVSLAMLLELIFTPAISFWTLRERYEYRYKSVVFVTILIALSNALVGVFVVLITPNEKGIARILSCVIVQVVAGSVIYFQNFKRAKKLFVPEYARYALGFAFPLLPHYLSVYILEQSDRIMIQKLCGMAYVGLYSVAYSAGMVIKIVTESITNALVPWLYDKLKKDEYEEISKKFMPLILIVIAILMLFIAFSPEVILILAGKSYGEAKYVIPPVASSVFFVFIYSIFANVEFYYEEKKFTMYISMMGALLNVILNYWLLPIFGFVAAAYTTLACYIIFATCHYGYMRYVLNERNCGNIIFTIRSMLIPSIAMVFITVIMSALYDRMLLRYMLIVILCLTMLARRKKLFKTLQSLRKG